mmetsp:Transcript_4074/g.10175  ORF Transcript_4074/g.10175 Transcript_4074/m.10175 type:complete len:509 (-) Transcript_4074:1263-2789(-)
MMRSSAGMICASFFLPFLRLMLGTNALTGAPEIDSSSGGPVHTFLVMPLASERSLSDSPPSASSAAAAAEMAAALMAASCACTYCMMRARRSATALSCSGRLGKKWSSSMVLPVSGGGGGSGGGAGGVMGGSSTAPAPTPDTSNTGWLADGSASDSSWVGAADSSGCADPDGSPEGSSAAPEGSGLGSPSPSPSPAASSDDLASPSSAAAAPSSPSSAGLGSASPSPSSAGLASPSSSAAAPSSPSSAGLGSPSSPSSAGLASPSSPSSAGLASPSSPDVAASGWDASGCTPLASGAADAACEGSAGSGEELVGPAADASAAGAAGAAAGAPAVGDAERLVGVVPRLVLSGVSCALRWADARPPAAAACAAAAAWAAAAAAAAAAVAARFSAADLTWCRGCSISGGISPRATITRSRMERRPCSAAMQTARARENFCRAWSMRRSASSMRVRCSSVAPSISLAPSLFSNMLARLSSSLAISDLAAASRCSASLTSSRICSSLALRPSQ